MDYLNGSPQVTNYFSDEPYKEIYDLRGDAFKHRVALEQAAAEAAARGFKTFKAMYRAYEARQKGQSAISYGGNTSEFEGQPMELETGQWKADDAAITRNTSVGEEIACVHPIMPVKRLINVDTGVEKLEIAFRRGAAWRRITVDRQTIASANKIVSLSDSGIAVTSETAKALVRYLHDVENMNYDALPEMPSVGRLGNIPGHGFSPYVDGLVFDGDAAFRDVFRAVCAKGDFSEWVKITTQMRSYSLAAKIVIAASFASALVEPFGLLPFFIHLWGTTSGTGKTVALMAAASVWADPAMGRYIKTFDSTGVGYEFYAGFLNSLPMIIDELQLARDERGNTKFNVYKLAEGVGRLRGNRARGIDQTLTWRNCIITSGETPLTQDNAGAGALNRIIDIECNDETQKIVENGRAVAGILRQNYGHAGREFINRLTPDAIRDAKTGYDAVFAALSADDATDKQALSASIIITADRLISDWFYHDTPVTPADMIGFLQTNASVDINERAYAFMCDWVAQNANRMGKDAQQDVYGLIEDDKAYIIRSVFNRVVSAEGYSPKGFIGWMKRKGLIDTRSDSRGFTVTKRIRETAVDCVCMHTKVEDLPF